MQVRPALVAVILHALISRAASAPVDLALSANKPQWLSHPTVGEPSWDAFERGANNPVYTGTPPYTWPVNGFLFNHSYSRVSILVGLYGAGYGPFGAMKALDSGDGGVTWRDDRIVVTGNASGYDHGGGTPDGAVVADEAAGQVRVVYDWATPANSDGGLSSASAPLSANRTGPFARARAPAPLVAESSMPLLQPALYRRVYGGTLIRRDSDWLVVSAISTAHNAGGSWAMCALTAPTADGPWSTSTLLVYPQQPGWHPHPTEFYPAFVSGGFVYAPATSIAGNRNYQVLWQAPVESAHEPGAWAVAQTGSLFHWPGTAWDSIWGQTFSGFVEDGPSGSPNTIHAMFPAKNERNIGMINLACAPWVAAAGGRGGGSVGQQDAGFYVSAPAVPSLALTLASTATSMSVNVTLAPYSPAGASPAFSLLWNSQSAVGPDAWPFPTTIHPSVTCNSTALLINATGWSLVRYPPYIPYVTCQDKATVIAQGAGGPCVATNGQGRNTGCRRQRRVPTAS